MPNPSLEQQRLEFQRSPLLAMPIAGTIAWTVVGIGGALLPVPAAAWVLFIATGSTFGLGVLIGKLTGENLLGGVANSFDRLFLPTIARASLAWAIAIPFFLVEPTSLPLSVGILSGMMWLPVSWIIDHWVGTFHAVVRTLGIVAAYFLWPESRFVTIPAVIVAVYLVSIIALVKRSRAVRR